MAKLKPILFLCLYQFYNNTHFRSVQYCYTMRSMLSLPSSIVGPGFQIQDHLETTILIKFLANLKKKKFFFFWVFSHL